jgi:hypothetical protein
MASIHVRSTLRRVGNSLAFLIPASDARRAGLVAGQPVEADIKSEPPEILGFLSSLPYEPFVREHDDRDD